MVPPEQTLTARWLFPVAGPPLERGTITIAGERIAAVEPHGVRAADVDLGNVAILPGFVNAHTHLDLSGLRGQCPPTPDFTAWLRNVIRHRRAQSAEQVQADVFTGLAEACQAGTTLLGDIAAEGATAGDLRRASVRSVVFREMLGLSAERASKAWWDMLHWSGAFQQTDVCRWGLSPHAPYSVNSSTIRAAAWNGNVMTVHLAETIAELELLEHHSGPFVGFLQELGAWDEKGLAPSVDWILRHTRRASSVLFAHGNYLRPDAPIRSNATIVYCPRTHAAFQHAPHPFREFLARGVRVALGTDSLASNPDLDVLAEARFIHGRHPDMPGEVLLRMATLSGAEALGWADETGSLTPGKSADLVVLPLPEQDCADPHTLVFESAQSVQAVMFRGRWTIPPH